jgi:hypothetical protein
MPNVLTVFRVALLSTKAEELTAAKKYDDAFDVLEKICKLWGVTPPSEKLTLEINLVVAIVASRTGRKELAAEAALTAARQAIGPKSRLDFASKCYAVQFANAIFAEAGGAPSEDQKEAFAKYIETKVDTRSVSPNLVRRFSFAMS